MASTAVVVNVIAFGALAWQLRLLARQVQLAQVSTDRDHDRRRKQATLEYADTFLSKQAELRGRGVPRDYDPISAVAFQRKAIDGDIDAHRVLTEYLNLWETLGNGIRFDVLDLSVIDRGFGYRAVIVNDLYMPFIEHLREYSNNPAVLGDVEWLAAKVRARRGPNLEWIDDSGALVD